MNNACDDSTLILVVGMHRSGTSLLGSILNSLNLSLPGSLIEGDKSNPPGYYERNDITSLQEELLIDLGRWWPSAQGLLPLPHGWLKYSRSQRAASYLKRLLKEDLSSYKSPLVIKDPRSSLLLPLWRQVCDELSIELKILIATRDPSEVIVSLVGRDESPAGMNKKRAEALWIRHHHQVFVDSIGLPLHIVSYSSWFTNAQEQLESLAHFCLPNGFDRLTVQTALSCIRPELRRSCNAGNIRLSRHTSRLKRKLQQVVSGESEECLRRWASKQSSPSLPTTEPHPWSKALSGLNCTDLPKGIQIWQEQGISSTSLDQLSALRLPGFPGDDPAASDGPPLPQRLTLELIGGDLHDWRSHLLLDQLPLAARTTLQRLEGQKVDATVLIQPLILSAADPALLLQLCNRSRVFARDASQVRLLRLLGVNAELLESSIGGSWLQRDGDADASCAQLGLPIPVTLSQLGARVLCLGHNDHHGWLNCPVGFYQIPCFPPAPALSSEQARLLASWVQLCLSAGLQLVRLNPDPAETEIWQHLKVPCFRDSIGPSELLDELAWQTDGSPLPPEIYTPKGETELLWSHNSSTASQAAICISSFNYAKRLPTALESCHRQTLEALELLIVDDASTDDSVDCISRWLEDHGQRFCRVRFLRHLSNCGLAAARNTAFASAEAPWCWVLDADNELDSLALEQCLKLAEAGDENVGVVHPLIRVVSEAGEQLGLIGGGHAWQKEQLRSGNMIDAMALIRRSAWLGVGGYSHIPGGWEDFDFWCKLIDANLHGVLCPQVLATYCLHGDSMLQSQTNQQQRRLSRLLQARHPWLQLAYAQSDF